MVYEDGMNLLRNESHSGKIWGARVSPSSRSGEGGGRSWERGCSEAERLHTGYSGAIMQKIMSQREMGD